MSLEKRKLINDLDPFDTIDGSEQVALQTNDDVTGRASVDAIREPVVDHANSLVSSLTSDLSGSTVSTGTGAHFAVSSARAPIALTDGFAIVFRADRDSVGGDDLSISGLPAKPMQKEGGAALAAGDIKTGGIYAGTYILALDVFRMHGTSISTAIATAVAALVGGAPAALDTLKELADAINDDANVYDTIVAALALKAPLNSPALTGSPTAPTPSAGDNSTNVATTAFVQAALAGVASIFGQVDFKLSGGNLLLAPRRGNLLTVNGVACAVPNAGVSLSPSGLSAGTVYYIYAVASAGVVTGLEASTTGHSTSTSGANTGNEIKTGDNARTLVGMVRPIAGPAYADTPQQRLVRPWHNRPRLPTTSAFTAGRSLTSTSYAEINAEIRQDVLLWADEVWTVGYNGSTYNSVTSGQTVTGIAFDSVTVPSSMSYSNPAASTATPVGLRGDFRGGEGYHYATVLGRVSTGTGTWDVFSASSGQLSGCIG